jgi:hypothetical protein
MTKVQFYKLQEALKMLTNADVLVQEALGATEQCYDLHCAIENIYDEICDSIRIADEEGLTDA